MKMVRKPIYDEPMESTSVRLTKGEIDALKRIGAKAKPVAVGPRTLVRVAVQEYIKRNDKGGK
jgi:hypothetical protein